MSTISWFIADLHANVYDYFWLPYWNASVRLGFFLITASLLAALKQAYEEQQKLARTDFLTELINRNFFLELLQLESLRSLRYQRPFTLAYLDIDDFKLINDRYGHHHGDKLLKIITQTIKKEIRATDIFARLVGDEFALLLP
ncbi:GGDEF domain-containing protein [Stanieria cyanosphaera]|uniref:GGDEF domain-containing protein n=1 Tax=Stanieria cyanosphaera TaxID=102116 RepID=UPI0002EBB51B|nr:GGDEF domain-containing protein [Stanieria cyanosphaera]